MMITALLFCTHTLKPAPISAAKNSSTSSSSSASLPPTSERRPPSSTKASTPRPTKTAYLSPGTLTRKDMRTPSPSHVRRDRSTCGNRGGDGLVHPDGAGGASGGTSGGGMVTLRRGSGSRARLFSGSENADTDLGEPNLMKFYHHGISI